MPNKISKMIETAEAFTKVYKLYENEPIAIREAMCLKAQYPAILADINQGELFAGRSEFSFVGFKHSFDDGEIGYFGNESIIKTKINPDDLSEENKKRLQQIIDFWKGKTSLDVYRSIDPLKFPPEVLNAFLFPGDGKDWTKENFAITFMPRLAEINLDYDKLLKLGIPGMFELIETNEKKAKTINGDVKLFEGMRIALEVLVDCCLYYENLARQQARQDISSKRVQELQEMADVLKKLTVSKPETLKEAIQLFWIYSVFAAVDNYGRMDVYLGDFYVNDLKAGRITEEAALHMLQSLWNQINFLFPTSGRVVIGGKGRPNESSADLFAFLALEATRTVKTDSPQLSLRFYKGMNPEVYEKGLEVIGEGRNYPMLYNDDINVPAVSEAFSVSLDDAAQYVMSNCGEYGIDHKSISSPNGSIGYMKLLELTLFNGYDPVAEKPMGLKTGRFIDFKSFEEFYSAYKKQVKFFIEIISDRMAKIYEATELTAPHLFASILFDDCIETGKGLLSGARYKGFDMETHSVISASDSLIAIKKLVFDKKLISAADFLEILKNNFKGYEKERRLMLEAPKFGNDDDEADNMALDVYSFINATTSHQAERLGMDFALASHIGVSANVYLGLNIGASPDGRKAGSPVSNSLNPLSGNDKNGITALLNSMAKFDPANVAGQVFHLKLGRDMFTKHKASLLALLSTYFENGGSYLNIAVMNRGDLEAAMKNPEKFPHLMVRVGGFSARFVTLPKELQAEIITRSTY